MKAARKDEIRAMSDEALRRNPVTVIEKPVPDERERTGE